MNPFTKHVTCFNGDEASYETIDYNIVSTYNSYHLNKKIKNKR